MCVFKQIAAELVTKTAVSPTCTAQKYYILQNGTHINYVIAIIRLLDRLVVSRNNQAKES